MRELIESIKDFKIIPANFQSAGEFNVLSVDDGAIKAKLNLIDKNELNDYKINSSVEVFGVNSIGLIYFETKILSKDNDIIELALVQDYSVIQRREYSRVELKQGKIEFKDMPQDTLLKVCDISAGGAKIITNIPLEIDRFYDISIFLSNNMSIDCALKPIRVQQESTDKFEISGKFVDLENVDRIVLVQYAFKMKLEEQNADN